MEDLSKKRARDGSFESAADSLEVKRIKEDLLGFLDELSDPEPVSQDLDSFMKSFEEEISTSPAPAVVDLTSDSGESQPQLGYLLEASDDELGLPPSNAVNEEVRNELVRVESDSSGIGEFWEFEDNLASYNSFGFGVVGNGDYSTNTEYVALDGLFEYSELSEIPWRHETLPAE